MKQQDKYYSKELNIKTKRIEKDFEGSSPPAVFIGSKLSYPKVNVGILSLQTTKKNAWIHNSPNFWTKEGLTSEKIIELRRNLINSRFQTRVEEVRSQNKLLRTIQELGMSQLQTEVEINLENKPYENTKQERETIPILKTARIKNLRVTNNTKISQEVEKVYSDISLKSSEAIKYLYDKGYDEHSLTQILSIGVTGIAKNRKLVPTRNSITAVDDNIGRNLLKRIREYKQIENYTSYFGGCLGNYYLILMIPELFSYELFEMGIDNDRTIKTINTDYENYEGRKEYASDTQGGYYAARLSILQKLESIKKQAAVLTLRFVLPEYKIPLGVWVCRNASRKSLEEPTKNYNSIKELIEKSQELIKEKYNLDIKLIIEKSIMLKNIRNQEKITKYF